MSLICTEKKRVGRKNTPYVHLKSTSDGCLRWSTFMLTTTTNVTNTNKCKMTNIEYLEQPQSCCTVITPNVNLKSFSSNQQVISNKFYGYLSFSTIKTFYKLHWKFEKRTSWFQPEKQYFKPYIKKKIRGSCFY